MGRPKQHGETTRKALLARAGHVLQSEGPEALSLRRLAAEVGTTTRAVYSIFGGKEGLLSAMYRTMGDTLARLHEAVPRDPDVVVELVQLCFAYRESVRRHATLYPLLFDGVPGFAPGLSDKEQARRGLVRVLSTLNRGIAEGRFRGRTAKDMAHELLALVHGLASLEVKGALGGASKACRLWKDATSILIVGFGAPPAPTL